MFLRGCVVAIAATMSVASLSLAAADAPSKVLKQLRAELREFRLGGPQHTADRLPRPDLAPLVGKTREQIAAALGTAGFLSAGSSGTVEVRVPIATGWALEMRFTPSGSVQSASWAKQE
jgi:hypothetical protein